MRRHPTPKALVIIALLVSGTIGADLYVRGLGPRARERVIRALSTRFNATVQLSALQLTLLPHPAVSGNGLIILRKKDRPSHPFIRIGSFSAHAHLFDLLFQRDKVDEVRLNGLQIHIAPQVRSSLKEGIGGNKQESREPAQKRSVRSKIGVQTIVADGTILEIEPKQQGKDPLRFVINKLTMHSVSLSEALAFETVLQNAKPPGLIHSNGQFGPWDGDDPRLTPVSGAYSFRDADLGVFKGIEGILSSTGSYGGVLERIVVNGHTDVPKFSLSGKGQPVHLQTAFHAVVDGTDGGTILDPVDATFLNSEFLCRGGVLKKEGDPGKTVDLQAETKHARIEDILTLVTGEETPVLTGDTEFKTHILIPPGKEKVLQKLQLSGSFALRSAHFTSPHVQRRLLTLSDRARGITKQEEAKHPGHMVASDLRAAFQLSKGSANFSHLTFQIPGAQVLLAGKYGLQSQAIDMTGRFRMDASLSDTQSGWKHLLLKPVDPLFEKHGAGFEVPFTVGGTRKEPAIGLLVFHHRFTVK